MSETPIRHTGSSGDGATDLKEKVRARRPSKYKVILHNDDYTTQEWVVHVLRNIFNKDHAEAVHIMLTVHHTGLAVVGVYARDVAESLTEKVLVASRSAGYPLRVTCEPE